MRFGEVAESVLNKTSRIRWDDATESPEASNVLKLQTTGAGTLPQVSQPCLPAPSRTRGKLRHGQDVT
eukprot:jgi/Tetstr1/431163/TSEL_020875.t1